MQSMSGVVSFADHCLALTMSLMPSVRNLVQ